MPAHDVGAHRTQPAERGKQRNHDSRPGERHRAARRRNRARGGLARFQPFGQVLAVAREYEQRVVDPHREAQHHRERWRGSGHVDRARGVRRLHLAGVSSN